MIRTLQPGMFTVVQDEGRWGYQAYGIPVTGAMDRYACRVANVLVGNRRGAAVLEMTLMGATFAFYRDCFASVCGAEMHPRVNGVRVPAWSSFPVKAGDTLSLGYAEEGCRAYLAIRGGLEAPIVLGSRSTYTRAGIGGLAGRQLKQGDILRIGSEFGCPVQVFSLCERFTAGSGANKTVRVLLGPQDDMFTPEGIRTFLDGTYTVSNEADRMGYRLEGPKIEHAGSADIISDALPEGAVQVPAHGMPIVMMADRQTTGGYPKIATVIGPDLRLVAQARPGDTLRFSACSVEESVDALRREELSYLQIQRYVEEHRSHAWSHC